jgi:hypothetical protein
MLQTRPTPLFVHVPSVLAVGCSPEILSSAAAVLGPSGVPLHPTNLLELRTDSATYRPLILLVDAELYDYDPEAFDMVALDVGAKLGVVANPKEAEMTLVRLLGVLTKTPAVKTPEIPDTQPPPPSIRDDNASKWRLTMQELDSIVDGR